jgi:hypothetical protein
MGSRDWNTARSCTRYVEANMDREELTMDATPHVDEVGENAVSRRAFGRRLIAAGAFGTAALVAAGAPTEAVAQSGLTDRDILNFALNLEYLEAEFYTVATVGQRIEEMGIGTSGRGTAGPTTGGGMVALSPRTRLIAEQIALDERAHVLFLRSALGNDAVAKPAINLEALGLGFRTEAEFIALARAFEDVGVSAYGGAARLIDDSQVLQAAAQIALTEAQHAGVLRLMVADGGAPVPLVDNMDIPPIGTPAGRLFQVESRGLSTIRSANQVLAILYASASGGTNRGGFFPEGLNGRIARI